MDVPVPDVIADLLSESGVLSPRHAVLWAGYFVLLTVFVCLLFGHIKRAYCRSWYGLPLGVAKEPGWDEVRRLMRSDPLKFGGQGCALSRLRKRRWARKKGFKVCARYFAWRLYRLRKGLQWPRRLTCDLILVVLVSFAFWSIAIWLHSHGAGVDAEKLKDAATVVGAGSILVAVFGIFYQGRVRARAENRQKWINELRQEMNAVIGDIPNWDDYQYSWRMKDKLRALETRHAKIELYLNPSERLHRAFMAMIRCMYGVTDLEIDREVLKELRIEPDNPPDLSKKEIWRNVKSDVIRLANVLLKREWEQVKSIS